MNEYKETNKKRLESETYKRQKWEVVYLYI